MDDQDHRRFGRLRAEAPATGGFCLTLPSHEVALLSQGSDRLVVSFDNLAQSREEEDRLPWGHAFLWPQGYDVLGILSKQLDWFRHESLIDALETLARDGLFRRYRQVSFYGASMGGFGALTFSRLSPGAHVMVFAPQTSLSTDVTPFENRYRVGSKVGRWEDSRYRDAAEATGLAASVTLAYDPEEAIDRQHADRVTGPHVTKLRMPGTGHKIPPTLLKMKILKPVADAGLNGQLTPAKFAALYRARHQSVPWILALLDKAVSRGHAKMALFVAERQLEQNNSWKLRQKVRELRRLQ